MKIKRIFLRFFCLLLIFSLLPAVQAAPEDLPAGAGVRRLEGGQRDFVWPVPGKYNLTSCYLDDRDHYSLDIDGEEGDPVVASYAGKVISIFDSCEHNYYKEEPCCSSWGNYVLLQHDYQLADGSTATLYSRYAHLTAVGVAVEEEVAAGQQIGTVGTTGYSMGSHLDYEILLGNTGPSETYGVDPYINELLELPDELYTTGKDHCQDYVAYVKAFYTACKHESYDALGNCVSCGAAYDWQSTRKLELMGDYTAVAGAVAMPTPYAGEGGESLSEGSLYTVACTVTNVFDQIWYEIKLEDGQKAYVQNESLVLASYFPSNFQGSLTSLQEGQVLYTASSHRLTGTVSSGYPLRTVTAYLDGIEYAVWNGSGEVYEVSLRNTDISRDLDFSTMMPGDHTLMITAADSTGRETVTVITCNFIIEDPIPDPIPDPDPAPDPDPDPNPDPDPDPDPTPEPEQITVTFTMSPENQILELEQGQTLGKLPVPQQTDETLYFVGWFTAEVGGKMVTPFTVPDGDTVLYAHWDTKTHTIMFDNEKVIVAHGAFLSELPEPEKDGYRFLGWYMENGEKMTAYTTITEDIQLQSQWEALRYTVTLDPNGGSVYKDSFEVTFGEGYGKLPKPERKGYIFMGWKLGSRAITETVKVQTAKDHTLIAVWREENPATLWAIPAVTLGLAGVIILFYILGQRRKRGAI